MAKKAVKTVPSNEYIAPESPIFIPERVRILHEGAELTSGSRDATYGDPQINLQCQEELWQIFEKFYEANSLLDEEYSLAFLGTMKHVFAKLARIACGRYHRDNFVDAATYIAIAGEVCNKSNLVHVRND